MYNFDIYNVITKVRTVAIYVFYANLKKNFISQSYLCQHLFEDHVHVWMTHREVQGKYKVTLQ